MFLGIHSVALTISEIFWNLKGESGYKKFLEKFVDGNTKDTKFSSIADKIHNWRNVLAHQWLASSGYQIQYDYEIKFGFIVKDGLLTINPKIYCDHYLNAFRSTSRGGKIWNYRSIFNSEQLEEIKQRLIYKFIKK